MAISDWFERLWHRQAKHYVYAPIPANRQQTPVQETKLESEKHYLRIWLSEMFLADDRRLFRQFVPVLHSAVRLQFASNPVEELPYVAGPQNVGLGSTLGRGVQLNHPLTNLLPFRGGTVALSAALLAYKEKDFFKGFLDVLNDVSGLLNAGQLSAVLPVVGGAVDGIQSLLGAGEKDVHLIYFQAFGGDTAGGGSALHSGYTAVVAADATRFDEKKLWVRDARLHFGDSLASSQPLQGYDYMLLRVEATETRDDFLGFTELSKLLAQAISEGLRDRTSGDQLMIATQLAVWGSPDFTSADRVRVARALKREYERAIGAGDVAAVSGLEVGAEALNTRILAEPVDDAARASAALSRDGKLPLKDFLNEVQ
jgi:hypothetical protein